MKLNSMFTRALAEADEAEEREYPDKIRKAFVDAYLGEEVVYTAFREFKGKKNYLSIDGEYGSEIVVLTDLDYDSEMFDLKIPFKPMTLKNLLDWVLEYNIDGIAIPGGLSDLYMEGGFWEFDLFFLNKMVEEAKRSMGIKILDVNDEIEYIVKSTGCTEEEAEKYIEAEAEYLESKGIIVENDSDEPLESEIVIDNDDMIQYIINHTGISYEQAEKIDDAEYDFYKKSGIVNEEYDACGDDDIADE